MIFFRDPGHFFNADSILWLTHRYRNFGEFLAGFVNVDPAGWYRPLTQRTVGSLLFPLAGLNPISYRVVGFLLFFSCTIAVYLLAERLTGSARVGWLTVLLFTPHLVHAFPTYDVAYTPELVFMLFYIGSTLYYVSYLRTPNRAALITSALLFIGGLLSKETTAALPFTLLAVWLFLPRKNRGTARSLIPHFAILGFYLVLAVGYLHVRSIDFSHLLQNIPAEQTDYKFAFGRHMLENIDVASSWAFGIPRAIYGYWTFPAPETLTLLKTIRLGICLGAVFVLFTPSRNFLILGIAWFVTALAPTLPLVNHFLPSYLFAPLAGFALAGATVLDWIWTQCSKIAPPTAIAPVAILISAWMWIHANTAQRIVANSSLLGAAAENAGSALADIQKLYPTLPEGVRLVLFNEGNPAVAPDQMGGMLFQLAYEDASLEVQYSTEGLSVPAHDPNAQKVLAFEWLDGHFVDITPLVRQRPDLLLPRIPGRKLPD